MNRSTPSALSAAAEKHLSSYARAALAGVGVLTSAQVAHAGIMTFTYGPQVLAPGSGTTSTFQLCTNGPTLRLENHANFSFYVGALASHGLGLVGGAGNTNYAANLTAGAAISAGRTFLAPTNVRIGYNEGPGPNNGNFINQTGYIGFKFTDPTNAAQTDYGWIYVTENPLQSVLTIRAAAYDNTGAKINAGQAPEPGSLGLLAGGAGCLAAWRLRKAKRKSAMADGAGTALVS